MAGSAPAATAGNPPCTRCGTAGSRAATSYSAPGHSRGGATGGMAWPETHGRRIPWHRACRRPNRKLLPARCHATGVAERCCIRSPRPARRPWRLPCRSLPSSSPAAERPGRQASGRACSGAARWARRRRRRSARTPRSRRRSRGWQGGGGRFATFKTPWRAVAGAPRSTQGFSAAAGRAVERRRKQVGRRRS